jgi:hypothetical protein
MAKKFTLAEKSCTLGTKFERNGKGEGDDRKGVAKFSLEGLMLNAKELEKLLGAGAHERLFTKGKTDAIEPAFGEDINELKLAHRYVESTVTLSLDGDTLTLPASKITGVVLQPQVGGMTWMACDIETPADLIEGVEDIGRHCGLKIAAHLAFGQKPELDKRQKNLPLNEVEDADDEQDEAPPAKAKKGNGKHAPA